MEQELEILRVRSALAGRDEGMRALLRELVSTNSFTEHVEGGRRVAERLLEELEPLPGMRARLLSSSRFAPHLVAESRAAAKGAPLDVVLVGHLDTVFPPGTFEGYREEGGLALGPGVLDMKGGLVVILEALRALGEEALSRLALRLVVVSDEEIGSPEGKGVIEAESRGARAALVFEAGRAGDAIITRRKGTGSLRARATGRAAHAGNAHAQGANAIWALARFVDSAQLLTAYERGLTVNVGRMQGGQSKNTVPDEAEALLDFRYERIPDGEALVLAMREAASRAEASVPGTRFALEGGIARAPLEKTPESEALFRAYGAAARAAGLGDGESPLLGGGSDASTTGALGIPSIDGLGPRGSGFHTKDERIELATLAPKAEALARFLLARLASGADVG